MVAIALEATKVMDLLQALINRLFGLNNWEKHIKTFTIHLS